MNASHSSSGFRFKPPVYVSPHFSLTCNSFYCVIVLLPARFGSSDNDFQDNPAVLSEAESSTASLLPRDKINDLHRTFRF